MPFSKKLSLLFISLSFICSAIYAFNGVYDYGFSEISRGMGGSGAALPQDSIIPAMDPAGAVFVGHRFDLGGALYIPFMNYEANPGTAPFALAPGQHESNISGFFLPDMGANWMLTPRSAVDVAIYSMAGFGSSYPGWGQASGGSGPFGDGWLHSDYKAAATSFTYAHRFGEWSSWGVSLILATQVFDSAGGASLSSLSVAPNYVSNNGYDFSIGAGPRLGVHFGLNSHVAIAVSYQPEIYMSKLSDYRGLLPDKGSLNIPPIGVVGIAIKPNPRLAFTFDVQEVWNRAVAAYGNPDNTVPGGSCSPGNIGSTCYGGSNGSGFNWNNTLAFKVGLQWQMNDKLTWRVGFNHNNPTIQGNAITTNILAPGLVIQNAITAGFTKHIEKTRDLTMFFIYIPPQSITGINPSSVAATQVVTIHATGFGFGVSYAWV